MRPECIIAEFENADKARLGFEVLSLAGYGPDQISYVARGDESGLAQARELDKDADDKADAKSGAGIGGLLGGSLAAPVAASTLIGPFILVGPLVGVGLGAALGSMLGGARDWGEKPDPDHSYEASINEGGVLIIVTGNDVALREAEASLKTTGPISIRRFEEPQA